MGERAAGEAQRKWLGKKPMDPTIAAPEEDACLVARRRAAKKESEAEIQ